MLTIGLAFFKDLFLQFHFWIQIGIVILIIPKHELEQKRRLVSWGVIFLLLFRSRVRKRFLRSNSNSRCWFFFVCKRESDIDFYCFSYFLSDFLNGSPNCFIAHFRCRLFSLNESFFISLSSFLLRPYHIEIFSNIYFSQFVHATLSELRERRHICLGRASFLFIRVIRCWHTWFSSLSKMTDVLFLKKIFLYFFNVLRSSVCDCHSYHRFSLSS